VTIDSDISPCLELEGRLAEIFGLDEAVVAPAPVRPLDAYLVVGHATGDYISRRLGKDQMLGMTWGGTLYYAAQALEPRRSSNNIVVSLSGGLPKSTVINPYDNASMFARILNAECYYITAPLIVESRAVKEAMLASESVASVLEIARRIDMAVLTVVDLTAQSKIMEHGVLTEELRQSLLEAGAVGNICERYIDRHGDIVDHPINERTISAPLDVVSKAPVRVLAGGGTYKVDILRAVLEKRLCNVLITEEDAARALVA
ncbi:MAG: sugar-binding transcriptional regulator, partial [Methyloligellaceae bacterium]